MSRRRARDPGAGPHGLVCIDKPAGPTSFTEMRSVQRALDTGRAGHGGTLDPLATGLLLVLVGEGTKLSPWVMRWDKTYRALVRLGVATDTLDAEGSVIEEREIPPDAVSRERVLEALKGFEGEQLQTPPVYSAIKVAGRSLMSRARAGESVAPEPRQVVCDGLELLGIDGLDIDVRLHVGKGYYVRSFARDLGLALGVPAHLAALRRERVGPFKVEDAFSSDRVSASSVLTLPHALPDIPVRTLNAADAQAIVEGRRIAAAGPEPELMVVDPDGGALAMVRRTEDDCLMVVRGFAPESRAAKPTEDADSVIDNAPVAD
ncbi:MAG: tRNA pseudouridine(55) synthase TruB [Myxococcota bacterium]